MKLPFGLQLSRGNPVARQKAAVPIADTGLESLRTTGGWWPLIRESFAGAWQRNIAVSVEDQLAFAVVYACVTLKATDISKLRIKQIKRTPDGVWEEYFEDDVYSPVLAKPNHFQTRQQFIEYWMLSKFIHGMTYVLLKRNNRGGEGNGNVDAMYVLDPNRVKVLVTPSGDLYYELSDDRLSRTERAVVPARDIIHDRMPPLYHPLCGISAFSAHALSASQGLRVQRNSEAFFGNGSMPSGIVTLPDEIDEDQQKDYEKRWAENFGGNNVGRTAVLGAGTTFVPISMKAVDSQLIEQLEWVSKNVCTAQHVPPFKVGVGPMPTYNNIEGLNQGYYSEALQCNIEAIEALLDQGLGMPKDRGIEFDLDGLFRADTLQRTSAAEKAIRSGMTINEARRRYFDLGKVSGGDTPYLQEQNYSLEALAKRDAMPDPFGNAPTPAPPAPAAPPEPKPALDKSVLLKSFEAELKEAA